MTGEQSREQTELALCEECGTDHEGWPTETFGGLVRCLRAQAEALGAGHLVDQVDALRRTVDERRNAQLRAGSEVQP